MSQLEWQYAQQTMKLKDRIADLEADQVKILNALKRAAQWVDYQDDDYEYVQSIVEEYEK